MNVSKTRTLWLSITSLCLVTISLLTIQEPMMAQSQVASALQSRATSVRGHGNHRLPRTKTVAAAKSGKTPKTPFQRVVEPGMKKLLAAHQSELRGMQRMTAGGSGNGITPNFGGYMAAPKFPAYDTTDGDTSGLALFTTGDFNKDGKPDFATVQPTGAVNVILNEWSASAGLSFGAPLTTEPGIVNVGGTVQMAAADLNGDGYDDVVLLDENNNCLYVLINQGNATFAAPVVVSAVSANIANAFALADVNGDGHPDVLLLSSTVNYDANFNPTTTLEFDTFLNDGSGNLIAPKGSLTQVQTYPNLAYQGLTGRSIVLTDVNHDNKVDATVELLSYLTTDEPSEDHIILTMLGNGTGVFQTPDPNAVITIPAEGTSNIGYPLVANLNVVDINKDGNKDVVFSYQDYYIWAALGNGDGSYQYPGNVGAPGAYPTDMFVADLNGDGAPELVDAEPGYLAIYPAHGDGTFDLPTIQNYGSGTGQFSVLNVADFDGDGLPDPAIMNGIEGSVTVFPSVAGTTPSLHAGSLLPGTSGDSISRVQAQAVLDANGDGNDDIFFYSRGAVSNNPVLVTGLGDGKGNFLNKNAVPGYVASSFDFVDSVSGDFNGDGRPDLILHSFTGLSLLLSNGDGSFTAKPVTLAPNFNCSTQYATAGDVNGDGKLDLIVAYEGDSIYGCNSGTIPSGFYTLLGNGEGTFQTAQFTALGEELLQPVLVDLNGDGKLDLELSDVPFDVVGGVFNSYFLAGKGDGTFGSPATILPNYINASTLPGDINGDGRVDLVVLAEGLVDPSSGNYDASKAGAIAMLGDGSGNVVQGTTFVPAFFSSGGILTDLNGDGKLDLLLSEYTSFNFTDGLTGGIAGLGNGDGTFDAVGNYEVGDASSTVLAGNFLKDNAPDAAFVSGGTGTTILIAQGGTSETLTVDSSSVTVGGSADFTVTLAATLSGRPTPTGTVTLVEGAASLASGTLNGGTANITVSGLAAGPHTETAVYGGDSNFNFNATAETTVNVLPVGAITLSPNAASLSLTQGQTGVVTLTTAANAGFAGDVAFAVTGAPSGVSVSVNPSSVTLAAGQSAGVSVVVSTTTGKGMMQLGRTGGGAAKGLAAAGVALGMLLLLPVRRYKMPRLLLALGGVMLSLGVLSGCGGSGITVAPKGKYTLTVTATPSGSAAAQTATIKLTIQ
jgi:hypothetical protein